MKAIIVVILGITLTLAWYILSHSIKSQEVKTNQATPVRALVPTIGPTETEPLPTQTKNNDEVQLLKATYGPPDGFAPGTIRVKKGKPVRLEVLATENGIGCMSTIMIPDFSDDIQLFKKNQTHVFEFTPENPGEYWITCAMGVPHADLVVE